MGRNTSSLCHGDRCGMEASEESFPLDVVVEGLNIADERFIEVQWHYCRHKLRTLASCKHSNGQNGLENIIDEENVIIVSRSPISAWLVWGQRIYQATLLLGGEPHIAQSWSSGFADRESWPSCSWSRLHICEAGYLQLRTLKHCFVLF